MSKKLKFRAINFTVFCLLPENGVFSYNYITPVFGYTTHLDYILSSFLIAWNHRVSAVISLSTTKSSRFSSANKKESSIEQAPIHAGGVLFFHFVELELFSAS